MTLLTGVAGAVAGLLAGVVLFGGLAVTVARLPASRRPVRLVLVSLVARAAVVGGLLVASARLGPGPLVVALVALLAVRTVLIRRAAEAVPAAAEPDGGGSWT